MKKQCKDCKWCDLSGGVEFAKCNLLKKGYRSKVDGSSVNEGQGLKYCDIIRSSLIGFGYISCYIFGICGPQGRYFKLKDVKSEVDE